MPARHSDVTVEAPLLPAAGTPVAHDAAALGSRLRQEVCHSEALPLSGRQASRLQSTGQPPPGDRPMWRHAPTAMALATVSLGVIDLLSALTPERADRLRALTEVVPLGVAQGASAGTAVAGLLLVMLGHGMRRRKRRAWRAAVGLMLVTIVLHLVKGLDVEEATLSLAIVIVMLTLSRQFYAAGDPRARLRAPVTFAAMTAMSVALGYLLLVARGGSVLGSPSVMRRLREVLEGLVGVAGPVRFRNDGSADLVFAVLVAFGGLTLLVTAYLALRPAEPECALTADDEGRVRDLLRAHGFRDSLGYFAVRRDRGVIFSRTRKAAVSYRVVSGVMLAAGDPIGDPEAWPGAIRAFVSEAHRHAWVPAVVGCSERGGEAWVRHAGLRALELGDEAVLDVGEFTLDGRAMRNVRQMVARVERLGYSTTVRRVGDLTAEEIADIRRQSAAWRGAEVERGFSMALGRFGDPADAECLSVTAHRDGRLAAILHFVPWGADGLSLDLMRRDRHADPGLNELLIVAAIKAAPALGITRVSLNFSVFRSALERGGRLGAGPVLRAWRALLLWISRWFQIESLYRFNAKFRPVWEPRFICYPSAADLPRVAIAALEAEAFLVGPKRWMSGRRVWWRQPVTAEVAPP